MIIFGFIALNALMQLMNFQFSVPIIISFVVFGAATYGCYIAKNNQRIEFEYTFTNGELDIAKVIANTKRKHLLTVKAKDFDIIAPTTHDSYQKVKANPNSDKKVYRCFLNKKDTKLYYGLFSKEGMKGLLIFEPSEEMMKLIKIYNPRNVIV